MTQCEQANCHNKALYNVGLYPIFEGLECGIGPNKLCEYHSKQRVKGMKSNKIFLERITEVMQSK